MITASLGPNRNPALSFEWSGQSALRQDRHTPAFRDREEDQEKQEKQESQALQASIAVHLFSRLVLLPTLCPPSARSLDASTAIPASHLNK